MIKVSFSRKAQAIKNSCILSISLSLIIHPVCKVCCVCLSWIIYDPSCRGFRCDTSISGLQETHAHPASLQLCITYSVFSCWYGVWFVPKKCRLHCAIHLARELPLICACVFCLCYFSVMHFMPQISRWTNTMFRTFKTFRCVSFCYRKSLGFVFCALPKL